MEIAFQVRSNYREVLAAARWAESHGLAAFALPDHYLGSATDHSTPAWDELAHLAGLARETKIQLVDLVSPVTSRHPAVHAKMAETIHDMADGRFTFGLGTGWMVEEHELLASTFPPRASGLECWRNNSPTSEPSPRSRFRRQLLPVSRL